MVNIVNIKCQIFTPESYVEKMLDAIDYNGEQILGKYILENSCGKGNILIEVIKRYIKEAKTLNYSNQEIKEDLEKYIIGFEIDKSILNICLENLNSIVIMYGLEDVKWNIKNEDYLKYKIKEKIEFIVGNPPYIMYQNLTPSERIFLKKQFLSCSKGKFDYCYAFIEKSINELSITGRMSYIVPNSIFKNVFGKELRNIMKHSIVEIFDYKESIVFENALTSPAIICFNNKKTNAAFIKYHDVDYLTSNIIDKSNLGDKWLFGLDQEVKNTNTTKKFGDYFKVSNSVATLRNSVYLINKMNILNEDENFIYLKNYRIEKDVLRPAASPRSFSIDREEFIIFPYTYIDGKLKKFEEEEFKINYPDTYEYLLSFIDELNERKADKSAKWYEYGRSQALSYLDQEKILISSIVTNEIRSYRIDKYTVPYSGFYIIPIADKSLEEAEEILNSERFFSYLSIRGINANGKSLRFSVKDILNYPLQ